MRRVMIVGQPGSGKSTLSRALAAKTGLPLYHMDHIHWMPGWVERPREEKTRMTREIHRSDAWILEGGHSATFDDRAEHADTLIWLDISLAIRMWRVAARTWRYRGQSRPDLPDGCPEVLGGQTVEFFAFIWRTRRTARQRVQRLLDEKGDGLHIHILRSSAESDRFLMEIPDARAA